MGPHAARWTLALPTARMPALQVLGRLTKGHHPLGGIQKVFLVPLSPAKMLPPQLQPQIARIFPRAVT